MSELTELLKIIPVWALISIVIVLAFVAQTLIAVIAWGFKDFWNNRRGRLEKHEKALTENTIAIVKLQIQLERLTDLLVIVPKLKEDVSFAHEKIRELQNSK